jgi:hypothetical protein
VSNRQTESLAGGSQTGWDATSTGVFFNQHTRVHVNRSSPPTIYTGGGDENELRRIYYNGSAWASQTYHPGTESWATDTQANTAHNVGTPMLLHSNGYLYVGASIYMVQPLKRFTP